MTCFEYGDPSATIVLIQPVDEHDLAEIENELNLIRRMRSETFRLIAVRVNAWNRELSPWEAPAVFGKEPFGGSGADMLKQVLSLCGDGSKTYIIGGYSLAGLFALWAAYQTDVFRGVAAASPSVWFPGFADYMKAHHMRGKAVYLSLGDREEKTRSPVMATVGERIREAKKRLSEQGVDCTLEWNPGNHFKDADIRTAKAFAWVMGKLTEDT